MVATYQGRLWSWGAWDSLKREEISIIEGCELLELAVPASHVI